MATNTMHISPEIEQNGYSYGAVPVYCAATSRVLGYTDGQVCHERDSIHLYCRIGGVSFRAVRTDRSSRRWVLEAIGATS